MQRQTETTPAIPVNETIWSYFIEKTKKKDIAPTIRDIRDYYTLRSITSEQFNYFESFFRVYGNLEDKANDVTRTILGKVISNNDSFELIISNQDFYIPIIKGAQEDSADFKDNILTRLVNEPENEELIEFASKIDVEYKTKRSEEE